MIRVQVPEGPAPNLVRERISGGCSPRRISEACFDGLHRDDRPPSFPRRGFPSVAILSPRGEQANVALCAGFHLIDGKHARTPDCRR